MSKKIKKNYGWICPECGRVNAPHIDTCPCSEHKDYWTQPIYPNDYLTPGTPSEDPEIKMTPIAMGPFVDSPNVIGPYVDDDYTTDSQKAFQEIAKQTAWDMLKEISWGPLPKS